MALPLSLENALRRSPLTAGCRAGRSGTRPAAPRAAGAAPGVCGGKLGSQEGQIAGQLGAKGKTHLSTVLFLFFFPAHHSCFEQNKNVTFPSGTAKDYSMMKNNHPRATAKKKKKNLILTYYILPPERKGKKRKPLISRPQEKHANAVLRQAGAGSPDRGLSPFIPPALLFRKWVGSGARERDRHSTRLSSRPIRALSGVGFCRLGKESRCVIIHLFVSRCKHFSAAPSPPPAPAASQHFGVT